jgi:PBP1b-binding outer membrane lipoprotein LpoB
MKIVLFIAAMFFVGCSSQSSLPQPKTSSTDTYSRDMAECEREAAVAGAGSKAQAFSNCMKARNQRPGR